MTISETEQEWIKYEGANNVGVTVEMVEGWYTEVTDELKQIGLDKPLGGDTSPEFIKMIQAGVMGRIQGNITVEPTEFQLMTLGPYPQKLINKKLSVEIVAYASMDGGTPELSSVSAWKDFVPVKEVVEPLGSYQTGLSFFNDDRKVEPDRYKLTVQQATDISDATKTNFMGDTYDQKLEALRADVPSVNLGEIERNLSRIKQSKNQKSYSDTLDLKRVTVMVVGTADGVDKNGRNWAMYHIIDGTFKPTVRVKFIAAWVDPSIFNRLQAGEGSYLEIYGMIQKNTDGSTSMNACFVHPLAVKPLERKENQAQTDQQPGGVVAPEQAQIHVMSSNEGM